METSLEQVETRNEGVPARWIEAGSRFDVGHRSKMKWIVR